jgi:hypothetical protein
VAAEVSAAAIPFQLKGAYKDFHAPSPSQSWYEFFFYWLLSYLPPFVDKMPEKL